MQEKAVAATARLVGIEQLPLAQITDNTHGMRIKLQGYAGARGIPDYPALLFYEDTPKERAAFLISSRGHDWGICAATWAGQSDMVRPLFSPWVPLL